MLITLVSPFKPANPAWLFICLGCLDTSSPAVVEGELEATSFQDKTS